MRSKISSKLNVCKLCVILRSRVLLGIIGSSIFLTMSLGRFAYSGSSNWNSTTEGARELYASGTWSALDLTENLSRFECACSSHEIDRSTQHNKCPFPGLLRAVWSHTARQRDTLHTHCTYIKVVWPCNANRNYPQAWTTH